MRWAKRANDPNGRPLYHPPAEITVRWEDKAQLVQTGGGDSVQSTAYVLTADEVHDDDLLMLGTLADFKALPTYPNPPTPNQGGRRVLTVKKTPDLKATEFLNEAYL